jgi:hypothetical protein
MNDYDGGAEDWERLQNRQPPRRFDAAYKPMQTGEGIC